MRPGRFFIRESCVFFRHPGAESSSVFLISAALRGKGTGRLAGAPMRREPHAPPRPGVFRLRRLPSLRLRKTVLWVSSVRRSRRGFIREDSRMRGRPAGRFFPDRAAFLKAGFRPFDGAEKAAFRPRCLSVKRLHIFVGRMEDLSSPASTFFGFLAEIRHNSP